MPYKTYFGSGTNVINLLGRLIAWVFSPMDFAQQTLALSYILWHQVLLPSATWKGRAFYYCCYARLEPTLLWHTPQA